MLFIHYSPIQCVTFNLFIRRIGCFEFNKRVAVTYNDTSNLDITKILCHIAGVIGYTERFNYSMHIDSEFGYMLHGASINEGFKYHIDHSDIFDVKRIFEKITILTDEYEYEYEESTLKPPCVGFEVNTSNPEIISMWRNYKARLYPTHKGFHVYVDKSSFTLKEIIKNTEKLGLNYDDIMSNVINENLGFVFTEKWQFIPSERNIKHEIEGHRNPLDINLDFQYINVENMQFTDICKILYAYGYEYIGPYLLSYDYEDEIYFDSIFYHSSLHYATLVSKCGYIVTNDRRLKDLLNSLQM